MDAKGVWQDDGGCLVCGRENRWGLHLHFDAGEGGVRAQGEVPPHLQGFAGTAHGGIVGAILDEAIYYAVAAAGMRAVATGELTVRFRGPLHTETPFMVEATCARRSRRFAKGSARLYSEGQLIAEAQGVFLPVPASGQIGREIGTNDPGEASDEDA